MLPIVCIVGASDSGKTTFLEKLVPALSSRGYRVGTLKHDVHGFEMDHEGKDTWRHRQAGAHTVGISSPSQLATIRSVPEEMPIQEIAGRYYWDEDILLAEGFKRTHFPKIEIFRSAVEPRPICTASDNLMAVVTDEEIETDVPRFTFDQVSEVADLIEQRFLKGRKHPRLMVLLDGRQLPMKDFVQDFVIGGIVGMLSSLRGWKRPGKIDLQMRLDEE